MAIDKTKILKIGQFLVDRETNSTFNILYIGDGVTPISGLKPVGAGFELPPNDGQVYAMQDGKWVNQAIVDEGDAPVITPMPDLSLSLGYTDVTVSEALTVVGTSPITLAKVSGDASITFDSATRKFSVAPGLAVGTYPCVVSATNNLGTAQHTFNVVVTNPTPLPTLTSNDGSHNGINKIRAAGGMYMTEISPVNGLITSATVSPNKSYFSATVQDGGARVLVYIYLQNMSYADPTHYTITIGLSGPGGDTSVAVHASIT